MVIYIQKLNIIFRFDSLFLTYWRKYMFYGPEDCRGQQLTGLSNMDLDLGLVAVALAVVLLVSMSVAVLVASVLVAVLLVSMSDAVLVLESVVVLLLESDVFLQRKNIKFHSL